MSRRTELSENDKQNVALKLYETVKSVHHTVPPGVPVKVEQKDRGNSRRKLRELNNEFAPFHSCNVGDILATYGLGADHFHTGMSSGDPVVTQRDKFGLNKMTEEPKKSQLYARLMSNADVVFTTAAALGMIYTGGVLRKIGTLGLAVASSLFGLRATSPKWPVEPKASIKPALEPALEPVTVVRSGKLMIVPAAELVCGDIMVLHPGCAVPADGRILAVMGQNGEVTLEEQDCELWEAPFVVDMSSMTGESEPVRKSAAASPPGQTIMESSCYVFMETLVLRGSAAVLVCAVGDETAMGQIAGLAALPVQEDVPVGFFGYIWDGFLRRAVACANKLNDHEVLIAKDIDSLVTLVTCAVRPSDDMPAFRTFSVVSFAGPLRHEKAGSPPHQEEDSSYNTVLLDRNTTSPYMALVKVEELQAQGHVVIFIGELVNYAAVLKKADCGVATFLSDKVARQAADVILYPGVGREVIQQATKFW